MKIARIILVLLLSAGATSFVLAEGNPAGVAIRASIATGGALPTPSATFGIERTMRRPSPVADTFQIAQGMFGPDVAYPDVRLEHYVEEPTVAPGPHVRKAHLTIRLVNDGATTTAPLWLGVRDENALMIQDGARLAVDPIAPHHSITKTLDLKIVVPPADQINAVKNADWDESYLKLCGVDLRVTMNWRGPDSQAPPNDHSEAIAYQGADSSRPFDESAAPAATQICDRTNCVSLSKVASSICRQLRGNVVGYAFVVGDKTISRHGAYGQARTSADPPATDFLPTTKMQIASTSKVLTALATISLMKNQMNVKASDFFPSDWAKPTDTVKSITYRDLVSQKSGVQQYYSSDAGREGYNSLKAFFTQPLPHPDGTEMLCPGPPAPAQTDPPKPAVPIVIPNPIINNKAPCYTDTNFGLMRILLPRFAGTADTDPQQLADQYVSIVQDRVLKPVGVEAFCKPSGQSALAYSLIKGKPGWDWANLTLVCGDWGWYVSVDDYFRVLASLNAGDGKIISPCEFKDMEHNTELGPPPADADHAVGWDLRTLGSFCWLEKNGGDEGLNSVAEGTQTTSVAIFGGHSGCLPSGTPHKPGPGTPDTFVDTPVPGIAGVLFINSNVRHKAIDPEPGAADVLWHAFQSAVAPKPH